MTRRFLRLGVIGLVVLLASMQTTSHAQAQTPSRFAVTLDGGYLPTASNQDRSRWGLMLKPRVRVGQHGQLGVTAAYYFSNGADPVPSFQGADLVEDLFLLQLSYEYLIPTQGAVRPYFGFGIGPAFVTERNWGEPGVIRLLRDVSTTAGSFQLPTGVLFRVSSHVQLDLGFGLQAIILEKQAILQWPITFGVRVGRL